METTATATTALATYMADPTHSYVGFKVRHLGFSKVKGKFNEFDVSLQVDPADLSTLRTDASIATISIDTGNSDRDAHLRSGDFFESENWPAMKFESSGVRSVRGNSFELEGTLTIRDVSRPVVLTGEFLGEAKDPWGNDRVAFEASATINRKEFGLTWNQVLETGGLLVGEDIEVVLDIQAIRAGNQG